MRQVTNALPFQFGDQRGIFCPQGQPARVSNRHIPGGVSRDVELLRQDPRRATRHGTDGNRVDVVTVQDGQPGVGIGLGGAALTNGRRSASMTSWKKFGAVYASSPAANRASSGSKG